MRAGNGANNRSDTTDEKCDHRLQLQGTAIVSLCTLAQGQWDGTSFFPLGDAISPGRVWPMTCMPCPMHALGVQLQPFLVQEVLHACRQVPRRDPKNEYFPGSEASIVYRER